MPEHAVKIYLRLSEDFGTVEERKQVHELEDRLRGVIELNCVGEFDGNDFGQGSCILYAYGPRADALFEVMEPILRESSLSAGAYAIKRYGDVFDSDAKEVRVEL